MRGRINLRSVVVGHGLFAPAARVRAGLVEFIHGRPAAMLRAVATSRSARQDAVLLRGAFASASRPAAAISRPSAFQYDCDWLRGDRPARARYAPDRPVQATPALARRRVASASSRHPAQRGGRSQCSLGLHVGKSGRARPGQRLHRELPRHRRARPCSPSSTMRAQAASARRPSSSSLKAHRAHRSGLQALREGRFAQQILSGKEGIEGGLALAASGACAARSLQAGGFEQPAGPRAR